MVAEGKSDKIVELPVLTRERAADPRTFAVIAEAICETSVHSDLARALDGDRQLQFFGELCKIMTRRSLTDAVSVEENPLEALRETFLRGVSEIEAVEASMATVDEHWKRVTAQFGDKTPVIPTSLEVQAVEKDSERMLAKAQKFLDRLLTIGNRMLHGYLDAEGKSHKLDPLEAKRKLSLMQTACLTMTGMELSDVADRWTDPIRRFRGPLQTPARELLELRRAYRGAGASKTEIDEWDKLIDRAIALQVRARCDPAKFMAYAIRDADPSRAGQVLEIQWFHVSWFGVWLDPVHPHSLIMAPPRHGKSFCALSMDLWEVGNRPELRFLVLYDAGDDKVADEIMRIKSIIETDLYRAVFPEIRVLGLKEGKRRTQSAFTVGRKNQAFSREPTFCGAGMLGNINGKGFDRIRPDDAWPPQVREEPYTRERYDKRFWAVVKERLRDMQDCNIRTICTLWHPEDTAGRISKGVEDGHLKLWRVQVEPYQIKDDAQGRPIPLWPRKADVAYLEEAKWSMGVHYDACYRLNVKASFKQSVTRIHYYNAQYVQNVHPENDGLLLDALDRAHRTLSIDPAGTRSRSSSDTGAVDGRITDGGFGFVCDVWFHHVSATELLEWIVGELMRAALEQKHPYDDLMMESQGGMTGMMTLYEDWIPKELERRELNRQYWPRIILPGTRIGTSGTALNRGKELRLSDASPYVNRGCVRFAGRRMMNKLSQHWQLEPIPNSQLERLITTMRDWDGRSRFDAGDALTQWILYHKGEFQDPFAAAPRMRQSAQTRHQSPMMAAMAAQLMELTTPEETPGDLGADMAATFSKYKTAGRSMVA